MRSLSRKTFLLLTLCWSLSLQTQAQDAPATATGKPIKILMVANSFGQNVSTQYPEFLKEAGFTPIAFVPMKGGCSLQQHAEGLAAALTSPESPQARIYTKSLYAGTLPGLTGKVNLIEALKAEKWDYVTIQQYSALSFHHETYEPYAKQIIDAIHQYAPQAEILVHETWAYREDANLFKKGDFTQQKMYDGLKAAYAQLAADYHLRTIPSGDAFQAARATPRWHFTPDPAFDYAHPAPGTEPKETGSLNMGWGWHEDYLTHATVFNLDPNHANLAGKYLGGAVVYETLTGNDVTKLTYCPKDLDPEAAADLRRIAHETVQAQKAAEAKSRVTATN